MRLAEIPAHANVYVLQHHLIDKAPHDHMVTRIRHVEPHLGLQPRHRWITWQENLAYTFHTDDNPNQSFTKLPSSFDWVNWIASGFSCFSSVKKNKAIGAGIIRSGLQCRPSIIL